MASIALAALLLGGFDWMFVRPIRVHGYWYNRVETAFDLLAQRRPPELTPGHWEWLVDWTRNLHGNHGGYFFVTDRTQADQFIDQFEARLRQPVTPEIIDWIWDEYVLFTRSESYDPYRPTRPPNEYPELRVDEPVVAAGEQP
jgi:hypothetical protein